MARSLKCQVIDASSSCSTNVNPPPSILAEAAPPAVVLAEQHEQEVEHRTDRSVLKKKLSSKRRLLNPILMHHQLLTSTITSVKKAWHWKQHGEPSLEQTTLWATVVEMDAYIYIVQEVPPRMQYAQPLDFTEAAIAKALIANADIRVVQILHYIGSISTQANHRKRLENHNQHVAT